MQLLGSSEKWEPQIRENGSRPTARCHQSMKHEKYVLLGCQTLKNIVLTFLDLLGLKSSDLKNYVEILHVQMLMVLYFICKVSFFYQEALL